MKGALGMDEAKIRMMQLAKKGYYCSQILIMMGLEVRGDNNPDLVRAIDGLSGGCDEGSCTCGSLTGGCCLIAFFAGRGADSEKRDENYHQMMKELVRWFWHTYGFKMGGIDCMAITEHVGPDPAKSRCWNIMESVYFKVMDILAAHGIAMRYNTCVAS
jgi:hypothetical protein